MNQDIHPWPVLSYRDLQLPERAMREPGNSRPGHFCSSIDVANLFALRRQCHCPGEDVAFLPPPEGVAINDLHRIALPRLPATCPQEAAGAKVCGLSPMAWLDLRELSAGPWVNYPKSTEKFSNCAALDS